MRNSATWSISARTGIAFNPTRGGLGAHHHGMVRLDGVMGGNARHNGFGSAGVARKIVELYIADANQTLGVCYDGEHVDPACPASVVPR